MSNKTSSLGEAGGYPPFDTKNLDEKYKCPECKKILHDPRQADDCGCRYCSQCLDKVIQKGKCVVCQHPLVSDTKIPDKYIQRKILCLKLNCIKCDWSGTLGEYKEHFNNTHNEQEEKCKYCSLVFRSQEEYKKHLNPVDGDCLKQPVECSYKSLGCNVDDLNLMETNEMKVLTRESLEIHLKENSSEHLKLVYENLSKKIQELEKRMENMNLEDLVRTQKLTVDDSRFCGLEQMTKSKSSTSDESDIAKLQNKIELLQTMQNELAKDKTKLVKTNDQLKQDILTLRDSIKEYKNITQELHKTLALTQVSLLTLEERLINQEKLSHDGTLLWKITNVHERIQEAKSGRQTSFYSPPFYTNRNGYKMCARIYLNGDGNGRNTHLSLFFVILRGENDALLRWPFRQKVTFILIDQSLSESRENVYDAFRPDPNSSSFRRPVSDMNIASGLPVFCPLGKLMSSDHEYIKDNTMFIKIIVDVKDLPDI